LTIRGVTTDPTKATTTTVDKALYYIQGKTMRIRYIYATENQGTATNGSGEYMLELPAGYSYDYEQNEAAGSVHSQGTAISYIGTSYIINEMVGLLLVGDSPADTGVMSNVFNPLNSVVLLSADVTVRLQ